VQPSLFDARNPAEIRTPEYPGERLIACFNPLLAEARRRRTPLTAAEIGVKVGRVRNRFKVGKHFVLTIADGELRWAQGEESIRRERALDGIYVIRTSEPAAHLSAEDAVRSTSAWPWWSGRSGV
jgi:hypothetical protein